MSKQTTAVEWLLGQISLNGFQAKHIQQAKEIEKQQMEKIAGDFWNEGASYVYDGTRKYESFEDYYEQAFNKK